MDHRAPTPRGLLITVGASSFIAGVLGTLLSSFVLNPKTTSAASANSSATPTATAAPQVTASAGAPFRIGTSEPPGPEGPARKALERFRAGVEMCVRDVIGVLPGTAPAIPITFQLLKNGSYTSVPIDYRSPVYSCMKYRETEPQQFQIQWQIGRSPREGLAIVWIDDDKDGKPDRALGIKATLVKKKEVKFGPIEVLSPMPKVLTVR